MEIKVNYATTKTLGINAGEDKKWYNFNSQENPQAIEVMRQHIEKLRPGTVIDILLDEQGRYTDYTVIAEPKESEHGNREVVQLKELLSAANKKGMKGNTMQILKIDYEKKMAHIVQIVHMPTGDFMDAACKSADTMTNQQSKYWFETISSQALARALRWASNTGDVSDVEIEGEKKEDDEAK